MENKSSRVRISSSVDKGIYKNLKKLSSNSRIPVSKLLDEAVDDLLKKHNQE